MRIAMISTPFVAVPPARYGGTELIVHVLVRQLQSRGHEVVLYATGDSSVPGVEVRALYDAPVWPPDAYREIAHSAFAVEDILRRDFDVVHAHAAPVLAFARLLDVPVVYTVHHDRSEALCDLYRTVRASNSRIVCISERQRELLSDTCDAQVVHHGLELERYPLSEQSLGYAAFLGRFAPEKGVHMAIDAAVRAGVPLRLGGRPHECDRDYFEAEVEPRLGGPGLEWLGELGHPAKVELLSGAVATLCPIDWEEPFGLVLLESMLVGTPVLAFPRGAAPELIDEGVTGYLVADVDDMVARLRALASGKLAFDRVRCRAHAARRFSAERMADGYLAVYEEAAGLASAPGRPVRRVELP